jgi:hypothetical protein
VIAKKEFRIGITPEITGDPLGIPEPGTLALAVLAACALGVAGRRQR